MPLIECIAKIFPEEHAPYSMPEIVSRLQRLYSPHLSRSSIYAAHKELRQSTAFVALVAPLDPDASELVYSAVGAQRIARKVIANRMPGQIAPRMLPPAKIPKMLPVGNSGMQTGLK